MPHKCPCCDGWGKRPKRNAEGNWEDTDCPSCGGTGLVWDKQSAAPSYPYWPHNVLSNQQPLGLVSNHDLGVQQVPGVAGKIATNGTIWTTSKT